MPKSIAKAMLAVSAVLFLLATFAEGISWEATTLRYWELSGGIQNPAVAFYLFALLASVGVLLFGVTLSFRNLRAGVADRRNFLWSVLLSAGVLAIPLFFVDSLHPGFSLIAWPDSIAVLLISVILTFSNLKKRTAERRHFLGSELLVGGVLAILFAVFEYMLFMVDEGPRCIFGCAPSLVQSYQEVYVGMTILAILGLIVAGFGIRLLIRKENPIERGTLSTLDDRKNDTVAI